MMIKINYLEKPTSHDERAVAAVFSDLAKAVQGNDLGTLNALFDPEALIDIPTTKKTHRNKEEFFQSMLKANKQLRMLTYDKVLIRILNSNQASLTYQLRLNFYQDFVPKVIQRHLKMKKKGNKWYISAVREII